MVKRNEVSAEIWESLKHAGWDKSRPDAQEIADVLPELADRCLTIEKIDGVYDASYDNFSIKYKKPTYYVGHSSPTIADALALLWIKLEGDKS